ncbi:hypothetical protein ACOMHN_021824 [Nucella lapillus]
MLQNLNDITRHLQDLTSSFEEYDEQLQRAVPVQSMNGRMLKRSSGNGVLSDIRRKRRLLTIMKSLFDNVQRSVDRQKKWATCNLNLGFTCQTEEYNDIANYYDFLNSIQSPGKKRSVPTTLADHS